MTTKKNKDYRKNFVPTSMKVAMTVLLSFVLTAGLLIGADLLLNWKW